jgi:hypothetical protein
MALLIIIRGPLEAINQYFLFYARYMQIFRSKSVGVQEISVDCENKKPEQIVDEIFDAVSL